jgi:hypothetical protein
MDRRPGRGGSGPVKPALFLAPFVALALAAQAFAQTLAAGAAELQKCEDRIAAVQRDVLGKYDDALAELLTSLQKSADLEGALAVRAERQRLGQEQSLAEKNFVTEPKALRALQSQTATKMQDLVGQLITDSLPRLVELKKQLTVAGKLDDAVAVREAIGKLQNGYLPGARVENGSVVMADPLLLAYSADRARADKIYKGQKIVVHGVVGAFRPDAADAKSYQVFVTGSNVSGWIQCDFRGGETRFREEKPSYNITLLVVTSKEGENFRLQKGSTIDVRGMCDGWDEVVHLSKCEMVR